MASLLLHALAAYLLFSLATSSSQQSAPETISGTAVVTVSRVAPKKPVPVSAVRKAVPAPHASVVPRPRPVAQPRSAPPHPRVLHVLAKFAPTAPPNPTPAPISSAAPNPAPTQPQLTVTPAPLPASVPTSAPATVTSVAIRIPPTAAPTAAPSPKPTLIPTAVPSATPKPSAPPATPVPEPSALAATAAPLVAVSTPQPLVTPGNPSQLRVPQPLPAATPAHGTAPTPGPAASASPGPSGVAPVKGPQVARPIQAPPSTPRPAPAAPSKRAKSLNQRLNSLIPTAAPSMTPATPHHYSYLNIKTTPIPMPTPPADVIAHTQFTFEENTAGQHWKGWPLGSAPEEAGLKMWVTSVKRIGPIKWCTGWLVRSPEAGNQHWIVEPNVSYICAGHLEPFTPPTPEPPDGS